MKNKLLDLNNHLFEQMERLNDDDLQGDKLESEIKRSVAMNCISKQVIDIGRLALEAKKVVSDGLVHEGDVPEILKLEK